MVYEDTLRDGTIGAGRHADHLPRCIKPWMVGATLMIGYRSLGVSATAVPASVSVAPDQPSANPRRAKSTSSDTPPSTNPSLPVLSVSPADPSGLVAGRTMHRSNQCAYTSAAFAVATTSGRLVAASAVRSILFPPTHFVVSPLSITEPMCSRTSAYPRQMAPIPLTQIRATERAVLAVLLPAPSALG